MGASLLSPHGSEFHVTRSQNSARLKPSVALESARVANAKKGVGCSRDLFHASPNELISRVKSPLKGSFADHTSLSQIIPYT